MYCHDVFVQLFSIQVISTFERLGGFKEWGLKFWNRRLPPVYMRLHFVTEEMLRAMLEDLELQVLEVRKDIFLITSPTLNNDFAMVKIRRHRDST